MHIIRHTCIDYDGKQTWQIMYDPEFRPEIIAWLIEQGLGYNMSDRMVDENNNIIWRIIFGRVIETLLLTRKEDATLAIICWGIECY